MLIDHQMLGSILFWLLCFVGGASVITGFGVRSSVTLPYRIAFLLYISVCPFLYMVGYGLLGALDEIEPTVFSAFWLFCATPILSSCAILGLYVSWAYIYWTFSRAVQEIGKFVRRAPTGGQRIKN